MRQIYEEEIRKKMGENVDFGRDYMKTIDHRSGHLLSIHTHNIHPLLIPEPFKVISCAPRGKGFVHSKRDA